MRHGPLMRLGAITGAFAFYISFFASPDAIAIMLAFGGGCLFGKGYGIWEERALRTTKGGGE